MTPLKIALHGSYFMRNFGDTLLLRILRDWIKEHGEHDIVLPMVNSIREAEEIGARKIGNREWSGVDVLLFGGGGYFGEPNFPILKKHYWYVRNWHRHLRWQKKINQAYTILLGVGFGPLKNRMYRNKVLRLFHQADMVYVRDHESLEYLSEYGYKANNVKEAVDLAYTLGTDPAPNFLTNILSSETPSPEGGTTPKKSAANKTIGLHIPIENKALCPQYARFLRPLYGRHDLEVLIDSALRNQHIDDNSVLFDNSNNAMKIPAAPYQSMDELIQKIVRCKVIITSKLHIGIVATHLGIPVYAIPRHQKVTRYFRQIGYSDNCNPVYDFDTDKNERMLANLHTIPPPQIDPKHYEVIHEMKQDFFELLNQAVSRKTTASHRHV